MKFFNKLERKFGRYAIPNLMKYVVFLYALGVFIVAASPELVGYLWLDFDRVIKGEVWRLVTFMIPLSSMRDLLFVFLKAYIFYYIGTTLERIWGSFRMNVYFFSGVIFMILGQLIAYLVTGWSITSLITLQLGSPLDLIYTTMFFAFAAMFPNMEFRIYFLIPVKAKYVAWISSIYYIYMIYQLVDNKFYIGIVPVVASLLNFLIFYFANRNLQKFSPREIERRAKFKRQIRQGQQSAKVVDISGRVLDARHKCTICGRTELDDDSLEFRFCSKCDGNHEYCMEHLFTHEHIQNQ